MRARPSKTSKTMTIELLPQGSGGRVQLRKDKRYTVGVLRREADGRERMRFESVTFRQAVAYANKDPHWRAADRWHRRLLAWLLRRG